MRLQVRLTRIDWRATGHTRLKKAVLIEVVMAKVSKASPPSSSM